MVITVTVWVKLGFKLKKIDSVKFSIHNIVKDKLLNNSDVELLYFDYVWT